MSTEEKLAALRTIVLNCATGEVDGALVDLFSASACLKVAEALGAKSREKFLALPTGRMTEVAFQLLG